MLSLKRRRPVVKKPADKKPTDFKKRQKAFFKSESFKAVAVLAIIALVTSLILSVVYRFTAIDEAEAMRKKINDVYNAGTITPIDVSGYDNKADSVILNAFMAEDGACVVVSKSKKAYNAAQGITLFVIIKDGRIAKVANYSSSETPGLGSKALEGAYLEQYVGMRASRLASGDDVTSPSIPPLDIKYISGATKSSTGVRIAVEAAAAFYIKEVAQ
jgi:Na+-translocating ferredoxin:NAD+ oxidoreductase RnfG subunit